MKEPLYIKWIVSEKACIQGCKCDFRCFKIDYNSDSAVLDNWALHIRRQYITDAELNDECTLLDISPEQYLKEYIIPQKHDPMGSVARSNVITEVLIADLLEFVYNYQVPRVKLYNLSGKNVSEQGTDVIGYRFANQDNTPSTKDILIAAEVKASLAKADVSVIPESVEHSAKDEYRLSKTLNHVRRKLRDIGNQQEAEKIRRFQLKTDTDYTVKYIAAGVTSLNSLNCSDTNGIKKYSVPNLMGDKLMIRKDQCVFFIHGCDLLSLAHAVFERCCK